MNLLPTENIAEPRCGAINKMVPPFCVRCLRYCSIDRFKLNYGWLDNILRLGFDGRYGPRIMPSGQAAQLALMIIALRRVGEKLNGVFYVS